MPMTQTERRRRRQRIAVACQNKPADKVARLFKVSQCQVYLARREYGATPGRRGSDAQAFVRRQEIARAIENGRSIPEVAQQYSASMALIRLACLEHGVERQSVRSFSIQTAFDIAGILRHRDRTVHSIADECGLSYERVRQIKVMAIKAGLLNPKAKE